MHDTLVGPRQPQIAVALFNCKQHKLIIWCSVAAIKEKELTDTVSLRHNREAKHLSGFVWSSFSNIYAFYPIAFKGCMGTVFTHGVCMVVVGWSVGQVCG